MPFIPVLLYETLFLSIHPTLFWRYLFLLDPVRVYTYVISILCVQYVVNMPKHETFFICNMLFRPIFSILFFFLRIALNFHRIC